MLSTFLFTLGLSNLAGQKLVSYEQVEELKNQAFARSAPFSETVVFKTDDAEGKRTVERTLIYQGDKFFSEASGVDGKMWAMGRDGQESWSVFFHSKVYMVGPYKKGSKLPARDHSEPLEPGGIEFVFGSETPLSVRSSPSFRVVSVSKAVLDKQPAKLVVATSDDPQKHRHLVLKQWFFTDRWLLRKLEMFGTNSDGAKVRASAVFATVLDPKAKDSLFRFDPKQAEGFSRIEIPPAGSGLGRE